MTMVQHIIALITASSMLLVSFLSHKEFIQVILPNEKAIIVELAVSEEERIQGLMFREKMNPDQGMLLVFETEGMYSIWMMNMYVPLDILWLDKEKRIVHIEEDAPPCIRTPCPSYVSQVPAMYVLELTAGSVKDQELKMKDRIDFILPPEYRVP